MKDWKKWFLLPMMATGITAVDLWTKALARSGLLQGVPKPVLGDFFRFTLTYNYGITFGLFNKGAGKTNPVWLIILAVLSLGAVLYFYLNIEKFLKDGSPQKWGRVVLMAITGGALGNIMDRLINGRVTDFLDMGIGNLRWYTYNVADSFVVLSSIILAVLLFFYEKKTEAVQNKGAVK